MKTLLIINSIFILLELGLIFLLARQVGVLLNRMRPVGARASDAEGPRIGENVSLLTQSLGGVQNGKFRMYVFGANGCGVCRFVRDAIDELARHWSQEAEFYIVYDPTGAEAEKEATLLSPSIYYAESATLRKQLSVFGVPYAVFTDPNGVVLGSGLVNSLPHIESLLNLTKK